ncbi:hypothetical protein ASPFODRAFT_54081 [Aspergillus luchuensis CBS 106.47]|uniref:GATA-type domain-containing protein n=1 Tax=Aspergillus luchuensis (strain CBS 106.47) TaxID=1137211 RepID=A0A1M3T001_ASPLC|nr:hypothetical protein ASPFODRAFT_54081 [Aspergillus luchuensis CBS 106.47]
MSTARVEKVETLVHNRRSSTQYALQAKQCARCRNRSTPLWRNGPRAARELCNACGIKWGNERRREKEEKRRQGNQSSP